MKEPAFQTCEVFKTSQVEAGFEALLSLSARQELNGRMILLLF
jgi:hypothetical protein